MALVRITKAIFGDENSVLTVSAMLNGEYGESDVYAGIPCIVNRDGVRRTITLSLTEEELQKFHQSCQTLRESYQSLRLK